MSLQLNHAAFTQATGQQERLQAFGQLGQADAQQILKGLHTDLQGKSGVLRLLHTSHADKPMKFQRAGGFKQLFLEGGKLERSSQAMTELLRRAGLPEARVQHFQTYAQRRGQQGVETSKLMTYLSEAVDFTAPDMESALKQLGVSAPDQRAVLGEGGFGKAFKVSYEGQEQVLKLFKSEGGDGRRVLVRDDAHSDADVLKMLKQEPAARSDSFISVEDVPAGEANASVLAGARQGQAPAKAPANSYMMSPSVANSLQRPDFLGQAAQGSDIYDMEPAADQHAMGSKAPSVDPRLSQGNDAQDEDDAQSLSQASYLDNFQRYQQAGMRSSFASSKAGGDEGHPEGADPDNISVGPKSIRSGASMQSLAALEPELEVRAPVPQAASPQARAPKGVHLGRSNITNALRLKDMPGIVQPSRLLVREKTADGQEMVHAVRGGAAFKAWARTRAVASDLVVEGMLMPLAPGKSPVEYDIKGDEIVGSRAQVQPAQVQSMAKRGVDILKGLQSRGFIHGDIKPQNMLYLAEQDALNLIDTDDLRKISKQPDTRMPEKPGASTRTYLHPAAMAHKGCGAGRDLYALGVSLLETSLLAKDERAQWTDWYNKLSSSALYSSWDSSTRRALTQVARNNQFAPNSAEHFALQCIAEALDYEQERQAQGLQNRFERYTPDNPAHPLNKVSQHPFVA